VFTAVVNTVPLSGIIIAIYYTIEPFSIIFLLIIISIIFVSIDSRYCWMCRVKLYMPTTPFLP